MAAKRYYAEYTTFWELSDLGGRWFVFDRDSVDVVDGKCMTIALCFTEKDAFKIRDALNEQDSRGEANG